MKVPSKLTANYVETQVDGEVLIVDLDGGELFSLTGSALAVWRMIDGTRSADRITDAMCRDFAGDPVKIRMETAAFLAELTDARLVAFS